MEWNEIVWCDTRYLWLKYIYAFLPAAERRLELFHVPMDNGNIFDDAPSVIRCSCSFLLSIWHWIDWLDRFDFVSQMSAVSRHRTLYNYCRIVDLTYANDYYYWHATIYLRQCTNRCQRSLDVYVCLIQLICRVEANESKSTALTKMRISNEPIDRIRFFYILFIGSERIDGNIPSHFIVECGCWDNCEPHVPPFWWSVAADRWIFKYIYTVN